MVRRHCRYCRVVIKGAGTICRCSSTCERSCVSLEEASVLSTTIPPPEQEHPHKCENEEEAQDDADDTCNWEFVLGCCTARSRTARTSGAAPRALIAGCSRYIRGLDIDDRDIPFLRRSCCGGKGLTNEIGYVVDARVKVEVGIGHFGYSYRASACDRR